MALEEGLDNIPFNYKIKFDTSMLYDGNIEKDAKFKSKKMQFTLLTEGDKKGKDLVIGRADIDLANFTTPGSFESEQRVELLGKEKKSTARNPALMVEINVEWLKVNGKKVSASDTKKKGKSSSKSSSSSDVSSLDDALGGLDDGPGLGKKNTSFRSMKKKKNSGSNPEDEFGNGPDSISVGGRELTLEEPDPDEMSVSEVESNWDGDEVRMPRPEK